MQLVQGELMPWFNLFFFSGSALLFILMSFMEVDLRLSTRKFNRDYTPEPPLKTEHEKFLEDRKALKYEEYNPAVLDNQVWYVLTDRKRDNV